MVKGHHGHREDPRPMEDDPPYSTRRATNHTNDCGRDDTLPYQGLKDASRRREANKMDH